MFRYVFASAAAALMLGGCATSATTSQQRDGDTAALLSRMLAGESEVQGAALERELAEAEQYPLGSAENPVRAEMPPGQRRYLASLRCQDLKAPQFERAGSAGISRYGNIMDVYIVTCPGSEPERSEIYLDMYHRGHVETRAVPGFGIMAGRSGN